GGDGVHGDGADLLRDVKAGGPDRLHAVDRDLRHTRGEGLHQTDLEARAASEGVAGRARAQHLLDLAAHLVHDLAGNGARADGWHGGDAAARDRRPRERLVDVAEAGPVEAALED